MRSERGWGVRIARRDLEGDKAIGWDGVVRSCVEVGSEVAR